MEYINFKVKTVATPYWAIIGKARLLFLTTSGHTEVQSRVVPELLEQKCDLKTTS